MSGLTEIVVPGVGEDDGFDARLENRQRQSEVPRLRAHVDRLHPVLPLSAPVLVQEGACKVKYIGVTVSKVEVPVHSHSEQGQVHRVQ